MLQTLKDNWVVIPNYQLSLKNPYRIQDLFQIRVGYPFYL